MKENKYMSFCECGCGNGVVLKFDNDEDELSLQLVSDNFYFMQNKGRMSLKEKIKRVWRIVTNKEYSYFDILIGKDQLQEFKNFVARL